MDVDVRQEQPALLKLIGVDDAPVHLGDAFELVPGPRRLFEHHISRRHGQQCRDVVFLNPPKEFGLERIHLTTLTPTLLS